MAMCSMEASHLPLGMKSDGSAARAPETKEQTAKRRKSDREHVKETSTLETEELCPVSLC